MITERANRRACTTKPLPPFPALTWLGFLDLKIVVFSNVALKGGGSIGIGNIVIVCVHRPLGEGDATFTSLHSVSAHRSILIFPRQPSPMLQRFEVVLDLTPTIAGHKGEERLDRRAPRSTQSSSLP